MERKVLKKEPVMGEEEEEEEAMAERSWGGRREEKGRTKKSIGPKLSISYPPLNDRANGGRFG
jgi:hypothetical protein